MKKSMKIHKEPKITEDTRYDLPRENIKDAGGPGHFFTPKRLHKESTHAQTKRNDFPVGWAKLPPPTSDIYISIMSAKADREVAGGGGVLS